MASQSYVFRFIFAVLALLAVLLFMLLGHDGGVQMEIQQHRHRTLLPPICSHQILKPPFLQNTGGADSNYIPPDGSLDAMTALFQSGVHCFDVDVITLSDGTLLASHPRRLKASIEEAKAKSIPTANETTQEIPLEDYTLESLFQTLGTDRSKRNQKTIRGSTSEGESSTATNSPFPLFDEDILPHFAKLVRQIPGAFAPTTTASTVSPWSLKGPLLNIDLKQGPYLTKDKVLELARQIHALKLEDYVAVCVVELDDENKNKDVDLLGIMHEHNNEGEHHRIPLTLVLRDLVAQDKDVNYIRNIVQDRYPESIKAIVPSFKFSLEWYQEVRRKEVKAKANANDTKKVTNELWKLPMSVWTIDSREDYDFVASRTTTILAEDGTNESMQIPMASAVIANSPMELVA